MVVVQPTAFCNINCTYCYLPDRNNKHVIAQSTVTRLFGEIFASGWTCPEITVVWHAGEPLAVPVAFYREAFAAIEQMRPDSVIVKHSFQTNGMLIDIAHLIDSKAVEKYQNRYSSAAKQLKNCELVISGPWPPYHFMPGKLRTVAGNS